MQRYCIKSTFMTRNPVQLWGDPVFSKDWQKQHIDPAVRGFAGNTVSLHHQDPLTHVHRAEAGTGVELTGRGVELLWFMRVGECLMTDPQFERSSSNAKQDFSKLLTRDRGFCTRNPRKATDSRPQEVFLDPRDLWSRGQSLLLVSLAPRIALGWEVNHAEAVLNF